MRSYLHDKKHKTGRAPVTFLNIHTEDPRERAATKPVAWRTCKRKCKSSLFCGIVSTCDLPDSLLNRRSSFQRRLRRPSSGGMGPDHGGIYDQGTPESPYVYGHQVQYYQLPYDGLDSVNVKQTTRSSSVAHRTHKKQQQQILLQPFP